MDKVTLCRRSAVSVLDKSSEDDDVETDGTIDDLLTYCNHVAGAVGIMMSYVMGVGDPALRRRVQQAGLRMAAMLLALIGLACGVPAAANSRSKGR